MEPWRIHPDDPCQVVVGPFNDATLVAKAASPELAQEIIVRAARLATADSLLDAIYHAFAPVLDWYSGEGECTDLAAMIADAVADLQEDRAAVLDHDKVLRQVLAFDPARIKHDATARDEYRPIWEAVVRALARADKVIR